MAESRAETTGGGNIATEIPSQNLAPVEYADLPEPLPMKRVLGPSVLLLAGAIGSGEYVLWPYITSQVGSLWSGWCSSASAPSTSSTWRSSGTRRDTGETAVTGFTRLWKPWGALFIVMTIVPWAWPGWATGGTTTPSFAIGFSEEAVPYITIGVLLLIERRPDRVTGRSPDRREDPVLLRRADRAVHALRARGIDRRGRVCRAGRGLRAGRPILDAIGSIGAATLLGAIAFAGAGGSLNLVQSNWVRDKNLGMGAWLPRIVSPITGEEMAAPTTGYFFRRDDENLRRWRGWWKVADREQFLTFFVIGRSRRSPS